MREKSLAVSVTLAAILGCAIPRNEGERSASKYSSEQQREWEQQRRQREAEAARDEALYRRKAEDLAAALTVPVPQWQETWKARYESLQYKERRLAAEKQERAEQKARQEAEQEARRLAEEEDLRRRLSYSEYRDEMMRWLDRISSEERSKRATEFREKYVLLADLAAAGIENDQWKLLRVQLVRMFREELTKREEGRVAWHVWSGLADLRDEREKAKGDHVFADLPSGRELDELVKKLEAEGLKVSSREAATWAKQRRDLTRWFQAQLEDPPALEEFEARFSAFAKKLGAEVGKSPK